jgi:hypothetical protein
MPKAAFQAGALAIQAPLHKIVDRMIAYMQE